MELKPNNESFIYIKEKLNIEFASMVSIGDRHNVDILPLIELGGSGILISNQSEISIITSKLTQYKWADAIMSVLNKD